MSANSSQSTDSEKDKSAEKGIYFCVLCPETDDITPEVTEVLTFNTKAELETHLRDIHLKDSTANESHAIDLWIDRHIKYQESLNKSMSQTIKTIPDRNKTIYKGCPVCDRILKVYNISSESNPKKGSLISHELLVRDINVHYSGNNVNHINPHLKYYPYVCLICKDESESSRERRDPEIKEVVKTSVKAMMRRHIIDKHLKNTPLVRDALEDAIEKSILTLKVMVLERITKRHSPPSKPPLKRPKIKSIPGPLRKVPLPEPSKRLAPIFPISPQLIFGAFGQLTSSNIIQFPSEGPSSQSVSILGSLPSQPLMTWTPNPKSQMKTDPKEVIKPEEMSTFSSEEELSEFDEMKDTSEVFGCVFCLKAFQTYDRVFDHYLDHLNVFIECAKCELKFENISDFRSHNPSHIENSNLLNLNQYKTVRKWIQRFLDSMKNERQSLFAMTCDLDQVFCSVCSMIFYVYRHSSKQGLPEGQTLESHIHNHLNYFPFECIDCHYEDIKTQFCLDSKAKKHLFEKHDIRNADSLEDKELSAYFVNKNPITKLDQIIESSVDISKQIHSFHLMSIK